MSRSNRKYPNAHQVGLVEKALTTPRTVAEIVAYCGVPRKLVGYAVRILGFRNVVVRMDDGRYMRCER